MGIPAQFDHPEFTAALDRVVDSCERHGKAAGYLVNTIEEGTEMLRRGFPLHSVRRRLVALPPRLGRRHRRAADERLAAVIATEGK